eukprot:CAMPEP_0185776382 /NCGR_PEP_ID=MMETSP1174-20130828/85501_1 /TAXON_ID=35687 /ORGANISM="Dictyocha speculum, Strain CCMP1381" /LENGTH=178 /DNA_ID=CAMNT_0028464309 /DNA_START=195 /DNA_END=732 /DNA_ORIENTATION=-
MAGIFELKDNHAGGNKVERDLSFRVKFDEMVDYEPPQGVVIPEIDEDLEDASIYFDSDGKGKNRWLLSEDPDDRKDGLWIWGLFKEPLYPFMILRLSFNAIPVAGTDGDEIPPFTCSAQLPHSRNLKTGEVMLKPGPVTIERMERMKADVAGLAMIDIDMKEPGGSITINPLTRGAVV